MLATRLASAFLLAGCVLVGTVPGALALDSNYDTPEKSSLKPFQNAQQAMRMGLDVYRSGDSKSSVEAFKYAAASGNPLARWKLGKMYADGDGVPQDDAKAFDYFSQIVQSYDEEDGNRRDLSVVSNAFVALGIYSLNGIPNTSVKPDSERAFEMFQYAAMNFGNADAQYNLARLFLDGSRAIPKDVRQAARWLMLAADKNHFQAEALLGHLLFYGFDGMPQQRAKGLMWLTLAREAAMESKDPKDRWILELYDKDAILASDNDRQIAVVYAEDRKKRN